MRAMLTPALEYEVDGFGLFVELVTVKLKSSDMLRTGSTGPGLPSIRGLRSGSEANAVEDAVLFGGVCWYGATAAAGLLNPYIIDDPMGDFILDETTEGVTALALHSSLTI